MNMPAEIPASFDCVATAAVLRSGGSVALAGHAAALMSVLSLSRGWIEWSALLVWCAVVYLSIRVRLDAQLFELLAQHPAEQLDHWLDAAGLRKHTSARTMEDRRRGAMRLWRALLVAVVIEIALMLAGHLPLRA
jgi:hypothetical protein